MKKMFDVFEVSISVEEIVCGRIAMASIQPLFAQLFDRFSQNLIIKSPE
jgi:hypothetical protein